MRIEAPNPFLLGILIGAALGNPKLTIAFPNGTSADPVIRGLREDLIEHVDAVTAKLGVIVDAWERSPEGQRQARLAAMPVANTVPA